MYSKSTLTILATACISLTTNALPAALPAPAATYNVVDVGGPSTTSPEEAPTVYQTIKETAPAQTVTQVEAAPPAATVTETPEGPIIPHVVETTSTKEWTVTISNVQPTIQVSSSSTSCTSSTSTTSISIPSTTTATTTTTSAPSMPYVPVASVEWHSTTSCSRYSHPPGVAAATGSFVAPWNATGNYTHRGFAAPSGSMPSAAYAYTPPAAIAASYRGY